MREVLILSTAYVRSGTHGINAIYPYPIQYRYNTIYMIQYPIWYSADALGFKTYFAEYNLEVNGF